MLHKWIIPIVLFIGLIVVFPLTALSQKTLRLDLKKGVGDEIYSFGSLSKTTLKLVQKIEVETTDGPESIYFYYNSDRNIERIKRMEVSNYDKARYEEEDIYTYSDLSLSCSRTIKAYSLKTNELQDVQEDGANCILNQDGYITQLDDSEDGYKSIFAYEYEEGRVQSYSYNNKKVREYTWVDENVTIGGDHWDEYYTYSDIISSTNIYLPQLLMQTYEEDVYYFALIGRLGKNSKNLLSQYIRNDIKHQIEYQFNEDGYLIQMKDLRYNKVYTIYYDQSSNPDPSPDPTPDNNPTTEDELGGAIDNAPEGTEDSPTEIFIPSGGITLHKPLNVYKHIRLKGGSLIRGNDNPYAMLRIHSGYSLELDDITIDGNGVSLKDGSLIVYGKLKLKEGVTIKNCKRIETDTPSGAVCIAKGGELTMDGGTITGNIGAYGSAVYNEGIFTMTDGEISSNTGQIGAVANNGGGQFIMTGGKISSNKVTDGCGGVFVSEHCFFRMTGGEISGNEDCALYTWANLQIGGQAKVDGLTLMNDGNRLLINPSLRNNWQISYVETPPVGTIVAVGYNGYQLADSDLQKVIYYNNVSQLKLAGNSIVTYQTETGVEGINEDLFRLSASGNQVQVEGLPSDTQFTIYEMGGRIVASYVTGINGQACFSLDKGVYLFNCKERTVKFMVR